MLKLSTVPQGTSSLLLGVSTSLKWDALKLCCDAEALCIIPVPGAPLCESRDIDPGYLRQGPAFGNLNAVEHLDFDGIFTSAEMSTGTLTKRSSDGYTSVYGIPWYKIPLRRGATNYERAETLVIPHGSQQSLYAITTGKRNAATTVTTTCNTFTVAWVSQKDIVMIYTDRVMAGGIASNTVVFDSYRFNDTFTHYARYNSTYSTSLPPGSSGQDYLEEWMRTRYGNLIILTPSSVFATVAWVTRQGSNRLTLSDFSLDREQVFPEELNPDWQILITECYEQIQLWTSNGLAYSRDLLGASQSVKSTISLLKDLLTSKDPLRLSKDVASLFLSFRYGWYLSMKDTVSLIKADANYAYPNGNCKRSSMHTYIRNGVPVTARAAVYCNPYSDNVDRLGEWLKMMDFDVTLENLWDLIPLSFVVDWFTGLGDIFNRFDLMNDIDSFNVKLTGRSLKTTTAVCPSMIPGYTGAIGSCAVTFYSRQYTDQIVPPGFSSYRDPNQKFTHWLEASALVVQRL